jgi:hypothetical protein
VDHILLSIKLVRLSGGSEPLSELSKQKIARIFSSILSIVSARVALQTPAAAAAAVAARRVRGQMEKKDGNAEKGARSPGDGVGGVVPVGPGIHSLAFRPRRRVLLATGRRGSAGQRAGEERGQEEQVSTRQQGGEVVWMRVYAASPSDAELLASTITSMLKAGGLPVYDSPSLPPCLSLFVIHSSIHLHPL